MATAEKKDHKAVFGLFNDRIAMETAVSDLKMGGFRHEDISVLFGDGADKMAHENSTKAPEGATTGAATGLFAGGALGWLAGIGLLAIPGVGPLIAAGPIMAAIAGAGIGSAVGGLTGGLVGMGIPEYEAKRYETFVREGGFLLSVHVDDGDWRKKAEDILKRSGAASISTKGEETPSIPKRKEPTMDPTIRPTY